jgi:meiotically up-regulated gene 157 (Mug157) protein
MLQADFDNLYNIFLAMDSINPSDRTESFNQYFKELTEILKEHYHEQRHMKQSVEHFMKSGNSQETVSYTPGQS